MSTEVLELDEDTVEYRVIAYMDFIYVTACTFLRQNAKGYGLDLIATAQDMAQSVALSTLDSKDVYAPALGASWFKTATENKCRDFLEGSRNERKRANQWGESNAVNSEHNLEGYYDLSAAIRTLPEAQRWAIADRYFEEGLLPEYSNPNATRQNLHRARKGLNKKGFSRAA